MARVADTDVIKYNTSYHLFVLDVTNLKNQYGIDFVETTGSKTKADNLALRISQRIYNYIYNHKQRSKRYWEWYLAFEPDVQETLAQALIEQAIFENESNASQLQNQLGVNLLNGTSISLEVLRGERGLALNAINIIINYRDGLLFYTGKEMYLSPTSEFDYTEMGY